MNKVMHYIQWFLRVSIPKSTATDYYFDPKIMTIGEPEFDPIQIRYKVSELKYLELREEMIKVGNGRLKRTKSIYLFLVAFTLLCLLAWIAQFVLIVIFQMGSTPVKILLIINVAGLLIPNLALQCYWRVSMKKTCNLLEELFEAKNSEIYRAKGVNWLTCGTLVYIHIQMMDTELQAFGEYANTSLDRSSSAFETIKKNPNREVLLNNFNEI